MSRDATTGILTPATSSVNPAVARTTIDPDAFNTLITAIVAALNTIPFSIINATARIITTGDVIVSATDSLIVLNKSAPAATAITLPAVSTRGAAGFLFIFDWAGNAGDITITPNGTEKINGATTAWKVLSGGSAQTGGSLLLIPSTDLSGWLVR